MAEQDEGFMSFLSGLLSSIQSGAQSTKDAFDEDVYKVKEHRLPPQAMKAGMQTLSQMGNPSVNPVIPALNYTRQVFDPAQGWQDSIKNLSRRRFTANAHASQATSARFSKLYLKAARHRGHDRNVNARLCRSRQA